MYDVKMFRDYYNERGEYREVINYRELKSNAVKLAKDSVRQFGYDRAIVTRTGETRIEFFIDKGD